MYRERRTNIALVRVKTDSDPLSNVLCSNFMDGKNVTEKEEPIKGIFHINNTMTKKRERDAGKLTIYYIALTNESFVDLAMQSRIL